MNIWILVWLAATCVILYFVGWNIWILYNQRRTWKAFAEQFKLRYGLPSFSSSPTIEGVYKDYNISAFTGEHLSNDRRGLRKLTAIEVTLKSDVLFEGGVANGVMKDFLKNDIGFTNEIGVKGEKWTQDYIAASQEEDAFESYLTPERIDGVTALGGLKNAWVILIFRRDTALLRVDIPDALATPKKLSVLINKMITVAKILELDPAEAKKLGKKIKKNPQSDTETSSD